jgi:hypothetical protein
MPKSKTKPDDFDSPWKDALHVYFEAFLAFFFRDIHDDIDWTRGYESLDKEFQQLLRRAKIGKQLADKLFKVWLLNGEERWILIHVEVQGQREDKFGERMFNYNSAIRKLYHQDVVSLALLCDDDVDWQPTAFAYGLWGCEMKLTFRIAKLLAYANQQAMLEASVNPFALIVTAHLKTIATRGNPADRRNEKFLLVKQLLKSKMSKDDIRILFGLLDWMMGLPQGLEEAFEADLHQYEMENKMEYVTSIERVGYRRGRAEGLQEGERKGERIGALKVVEAILEAKFGSPGRKLMKQMNALSELEQLSDFTAFLASAATVREVSEYLKNPPSAKI